MQPLSFYYRESGEVRPQNVAIAIFASLLLTFLLSYLYTLFILIIPVVYVNFLITLGYGLLLGLFVRLLLRLTHNRNRKYRFIIAAAVGLLANFFQWAAFIAYAISGHFPSVADYLAGIAAAASPLQFMAGVYEVNQAGTWSILNYTFTGIPLLAVWVLEFLILLAMPLIAVHKMNIYPYSEKLGKWYPKFTLHDNFEYIAGVEKLLQDLRQDPLAALQQLKPGSGWRHSRIHLYYSPEEQYQYLTVERIYIEKMGRGKTNTSPAILNLRITKPQADAIFHHFHHGKERIEVI